MATLARPGRPLNSTVRRAYRLEMAGRTAALLLGLLALTGLVIFYLGVLTGKGLRDPNAPASADATAPAADSGLKPGVTPTALNHALTAQNGQIEGLKSDESSANQQTQQLLSRAKQELALEEVAPKPATAATPSPTSKSTTQSTPKPAPAQPAAPAAPQSKPGQAAARSAHPAASATSAEGGYTVQVFSSPQQQSAQEIASDLKKKGFPAYINQFQAADKRIWFRVRVGKGSRQEAESLAGKIRQSSTLQDLRVLKL